MKIWKIDLFKPLEILELIKKILKIKKRNNDDDNYKEKKKKK